MCECTCKCDTWQVEIGVSLTFVMYIVGLAFGNAKRNPGGPAAMCATWATHYTKTSESAPVGLLTRLLVYCGSLSQNVWPLTCVQQQPHHTEVWVWNAVVESRVAVAISHVDYMLQQHCRHLRERHQVVRDPRWLSHFGTGDTEPLKLDGVSAGELKIKSSISIHCEQLSKTESEIYRGSIVNLLLVRTNLADRRLLGSILIMCWS